MRTLSIVLALATAACLALPLGLLDRTSPARAIDIDTFLEIGGVDQHVVIRGAKKGLPVMILVHGGPGINEGPLFRHYLPQIEEHYIVVYWEQRGTGRSYNAKLEDQRLSIGQIVSDLSELIDQVRTRFGAERVTLLAHSWGTIPAALYVRSYPQKVDAYIGVSQEINVAQSERLSWQWALATATRQRNSRAVADLMRYGPPPQTVSSMLSTRQWVEKLGGTFHQRMRTRDLLLAALQDPYTNLWDLVLFGRGNEFSLNHLWPQMKEFTLERGPWGVPVIFVSGRFDRVIEQTLTAQYVEQMHDACLQQVWFEQSGHNPPFEEPARFMSVLLTSTQRECGPLLAGRQIKGGRASDHIPRFGPGKEAGMDRQMHRTEL